MGRRDHGFTVVTATRQMHAAFAGAEIDDRHVLFDPPADPHDVATLVTSARDAGALEHTTLG